MHISWWRISNAIIRETFNVKIYLLLSLTHENEIISTATEYTTLCRYTTKYHIAIAYCLQWKLSLFHIFTFIPEKHSWLPAFTSFHGIQSTSKILPKSLYNWEVIPEKLASFSLQIISNVWYKHYWVAV